MVDYRSLLLANQGEGISADVCQKQMGNIRVTADNADAEKGSKEEEEASQYYLNIGGTGRTMKYS